MNKLPPTQSSGRKRRGNSRFLVFFVVILCVLAILGWAGYNWLSKASWLSIRTLRVEGNNTVSTATITHLLNGYVGRNLLALPAGEIRGQLLKIKRIRSARVRRIYPGTLKVLVREREGFLYVKSREGDLFPIDEQAMVMEYAVFTSREDLPIVHTQIHSSQLQVGKVVNDKFLNRVLALQKEIRREKPEFLKSVSEYYSEKDQIILVDAQYGSRILLGSEGLKDQLRRYQFVQENGVVDRRDIFDMRFKNQVVVRQEVH